MNLKNPVFAFSLRDFGWLVWCSPKCVLLVNFSGLMTILTFCPLDCCKLFYFYALYIEEFSLVPLSLCCHPHTSNVHDFDAMILIPLYWSTLLFQLLSFYLSLGWSLFCSRTVRHCVTCVVCLAQRDTFAL